MHRGGQRTYSSSSRELARQRHPAPARAAALAAAVAAVGGLFSPAAPADTWDGGGADALWSNPLNWVDNTAPVSPEALVFSGSAQTTNNNDFVANTLFNGLSFSSTAGAFTLTGNAVLLGGDTTTPGTVTQDSAASQTVNLGLVLDGSTVNVAGAGAGALTLGEVTFGLAPVATTASTLNVNRNLTINNFTVQTRNTAPAANAINIAGGSTLNLTGTVRIGTPSTTGLGNIVTLLNVSGAGNVNATTATNSNFFVGIGNDNNGGQAQATLDMSALTGNFTYSTGATGTGIFGVGRATRSASTLRLGSGTNSITADVFEVGNTSPTPGFPDAGNNAGGTNRLFLGAATNTINTDTINVGVTKAAGVIEWQTATGSVTIRAQDGVGRVNAVTIGNFSSGSAIGTASQVLLAGHNADVLANTVTIGRLAATGSSAAFNTVTHDTGTFDVNVLEIARNVSGAAANGARGSFVLGGASPNPAATGVLNVNTEFYLGRDTNTTTSSETQAAFTVNGGTANINADIQVVRNSTNVEDSHVLTVAGGTLNITGHNIGSAANPLTAFNLSGGTLANAARINSSAITITNAPTITGTPVFVLPAAGTLSSPGLTLGTGHGIEGGTGAAPATVTGNVTVNSGGYLDPGSTGVAGILAFGNDLTLNNNSTVSLDLSNDPSVGANDRVTVGGALTLNGTVNLDIGSLATSAAVGQTYTLMTYAGALTGNETNFVTGTGGTRKTFTVVPTATTPNEVQVAVGGNAPLALLWSGAASNNWEVGGPNNWDAGGPQQFFNLDDVSFTDASTNANPVNLVGELTPTSVTVDATRDYTFSGTGFISGATKLTKNGSGTLTVNTANTYVGGTDVNAGVLTIGNGGSLGSGTVANNATLRINRTDTSTLSNVVSGAGTVEHNGTGATTFTANKTYTGPTNINAGTVVVVDEASLGAAAGAVNIASGATLDLSAGTTANGIDFTTKQFNVGGTGVGGNGAIINSGISQNAAFELVSLTADTLVNNINPTLTTGTGRFDVRRATTDADGNVDLALNGFTLTKIGAGQFSLVNPDVGAGNIVINEGIFAIEASTNVPATIGGNPAGTITYNNGTTAQWFANLEAADQTRPMVMNGSVSTGNASGTAAHVDFPMTVNGTLNHVTLNNATGATTLAGVISGPGALTKSGNTTLNLNAANTYAGGTTINGGTVNANTTTALGTGPVAVNNTNTGAGNAVVLNLATAGGTTIGSLSGTIAAPSGGTNTATINNGGQPLTVNQTAAGTYQGSIAGTGSLTKDGAATLTLTGTNTYTGGTNVNAGTLQVRRMHENNPVNITAGKLQVLDSSPTLPAHPSGDNASVSRPTSLAIANNGGAIGVRTYNGQLDLGNNDLILDYDGATPFADIADMLRAGYNGGNWLGNGITSSTANANPNFALAIADNAQLTIQFSDSRLFSGQAVDATTILVKFTHRIDLDLDGVITTNDATIFNSSYNEGAPAYWSIGDLDYDRVFTSNDATIFNSFYNEALASVPEPATLGVLGIGALGLLRRRRRAC